MPGSKDRPCVVCKEVFPDRSGLKTHWRLTPTCGNRLCSTCGKKFKGPHGLYDHCIAKRHGPGIPPDIYCHFCKRGFKSLPDLQSHMNALGHFPVNPNPVVNVSTTTNDIGRELPTSNPSTYLDGRDEISGNDADHEVPAMEHPPPTHSNVQSPSVMQDGAQWTPLHPTRDLNCAFCDASFGSPSAVAYHIESGCHSITRHQVTAAIYAMNIVPNITIKLIGGPASLPTKVKTYVATEASFNGVGYKCHLCRRKPFKTLQSLNTHLNSPAHDSRKFKCPKCKQKFKLISGFIKHLEVGRCGLANIPEITGYFQDLHAQFSGLLTM